MGSGVNQVTFAISLDTRGAQLALRCWDQALDLPVTSGLALTVRATSGGSAERIAATQAGAGWFSFRRVPGAASDAASDAATTASPLILEIQDQLERFLPVALQLPIPGAIAGPDPTTALAQAGPAQQGDGWLVLYSAPTRRATPGLATITGQLWDRAADCPAAFAVLEVQAGGGSWHGLADHRGCVALLFPYPILRPSLQTAGGAALPQASWSITLSVRYRGGPWRYPPGARVPDLREILAQPAARLFPSIRDGPATAWNQSVRFGQELVLRTDQGSVLMIEPAMS